MKSRLLFVALALGLSAGAHAATTTVFADNFNHDALGLNSTPDGWTVTGGTVDTIGKTDFYDLLPGNGRYIDLDGSTYQAGTLSKTFTGLADGSYTLSFDLAGNQRAPGKEDVLVNFGGTSGEYTPGEFKGFTEHHLTGVAVNGTLTLSFQDISADNIGALLDRVKITTQASQVPEPASPALLLAGLGAIGFAARRRKA